MITNPSCPRLVLLLGPCLGQDILTEELVVIANNVAWRTVLADIDVPVRTRAKLLGAAHRLGSLPHYLGEVTSTSAEARSVVVVGSFLIVPSLDSSLEVLVARSQVLSMRSTTVLELASSEPVVTKLCEVGIPCQGTGIVKSAVLVVSVQNGLLLFGQFGAGLCRLCRLCRLGCATLQHVAVGARAESRSVDGV